jgi:hypothetical protein
MMAEEFRASDLQSSQGAVPLKRRGELPASLEFLWKESINLLIGESHIFVPLQRLLSLLVCLVGHEAEGLGSQLSGI